MAFLNLKERALSIVTIANNVAGDVTADGAALSKLLFGSGGCYVVAPGMYYEQVDLKTGNVTLVALE